jgi:hypothetical protein
MKRAIWFLMPPARMRPARAGSAEGGVAVRGSGCTAFQTELPIEACALRCSLMSARNIDAVAP